MNSFPPTPQGNLPGPLNLLQLAIPPSFMFHQPAAPTWHKSVCLMANPGVALSSLITCRTQKELKVEPLGLWLTIIFIRKWFRRWKERLGCSFLNAQIISVGGCWSEVSHAGSSVCFRTAIKDDFYYIHCLFIKIALSCHLSLMFNLSHLHDKSPYYWQLKRKNSDVSKAKNTP